MANLIEVWECILWNDEYEGNKDIAYIFRYHYPIAN